MTTLKPFDLVFEVNPDNNMLHVDDELKELLDSMVKEYGKVYIIVNFFHPDVQLGFPTTVDQQG